MFVTTIQDPRDSERAMAIINGIPAIFPRGKATPPIGANVEVMINGLHFEYNVDFELNTEGSSVFDYSKPKHLFITPINKHYLRVKHSGFETGVLGAVAAHARHDGFSLLLSAGRTGVRHVTTNADGTRTQQPVPGEAFIRAADLNRSAIRIEGIPNFEDLQYYAVYLESAKSTNNTNTDTNTEAA